MEIVADAYKAGKIDDDKKAEIIEAGREFHIAYHHAQSLLLLYATTKPSDEQEETLEQAMLRYQRLYAALTDILIQYVQRE
jgi:hypothetical protein